MSKKEKNNLDKIYKLSVIAIAVILFLGFLYFRSESIERRIKVTTQNDIHEEYKVAKEKLDKCKSDAANLYEEKKSQCEDCVLELYNNWKSDIKNCESDNPLPQNPN